MMDHEDTLDLSKTKARSCQYGVDPLVSGQTLDYLYEEK